MAQTRTGSRVSDEAPAPPTDRRRYRRYRFSAPISICCADHTAVPGVTVEISQSGMSIMTSGEFKPGEFVDLVPVAGSTLAAVVKRNTGRIYGFEFIDTTPQQVQRIAEMCRMLPLYRTRLDV
jgi:hypothetical protein